jgi:competence protein ComEA
MNAKLFACLLSLTLITSPCINAAKPTQVINKSAQTVVNDKINLNKASAQDLTNSFRGIGEKRAASIVAYRDAHGGFKEIAELASVKGIGKNFVEKYLSQLQNVYFIE